MNTIQKLHGAIDVKSRHDMKFYIIVFYIFINYNFVNYVGGWYAQIKSICSVSTSIRYFPSGIAKGEAFCNRVQERKKLRQYIDSLSHTVLMAPRRYGKSSLITQTLMDGKDIYVWVDFLSVASEQDVMAKIHEASRSLLMRLSPEFKKLQIQAIDKFKTMSPELNLHALGQSLTLHLASDNTTPIDQVLKGLDEYAEKIQKSAVIIFDEFQQISQLKESHKVEALIRHAVERSTHITYIFSGNNRHMLGEMFSQQNRRYIVSAI